MTARLVEKIDLPFRPEKVVSHPGGQHLFLSHPWDDSVTLLDPLRRTSHVIGVGGRPKDLAVSQDGCWVSTADALGDSVSLIDSVGRQAVKRFRLPGRPRKVAFSWDSRHLVAVAELEGLVGVADLRTGDWRIVEVGAQPYSVILAKAGNRAYVISRGEQKLAIIELGHPGRLRVVRTMPLGRNPRSIDLSPDGRWAGVINAGDDSLSLLDTEDDRLLEPIPVGSVPLEIRGLSGRQGCFCVLTGGDDRVEFVDGPNRRRLGSIPVGELPVSCVEDRDSGWIIVTAFNSGSLHLVDPIALKAGPPLKVGEKPSDAALVGRRAYIATESAASLTVVEISRSRSMHPACSRREAI